MTRTGHATGDRPVKPGDDDGSETTGFGLTGKNRSKARQSMMRGLILAVLLSAALAGCGAVALPFRATADVVRIVPVAGDVVAVPFDAAGDAID
jgi:hypothetical protein